MAFMPLRAFRACIGLGVFLASSVPAASSPTEKLRALSEREKTFLRFVFEGDEAKATEFVSVAGLNPNSLGGEPLSVWFYRLGSLGVSRNVQREQSVQKIVFQTFKQNPNPAGVGENNLGGFCSYAPGPTEWGRVGLTMMNGTAAQKAEINREYARVQAPHVQAMSDGIASLVKYGLQDRRLLTDIFLGCVFNNGAQMSEQVYDLTIAKLIKAGADINAPNHAGERALERAVSSGRTALATRLIRDGADTNFVPRNTSVSSGFGRADACAPRADRSIYYFVFKAAQERSYDQALALVKALGEAGLSPLSKYGLIRDGQCHQKSLYDYVLDAGNMQFAKTLQEVAAEIRPRATRAAVALPAAPASPAAPQPGSGGVKNTRIGAWMIFSLDNARPIAVSRSESTGGNLEAIRLECVAGGKLEYVPVHLNKEPISTLWIDSVESNQIEIRLVNGRATAKMAAELSKHFLTAEAVARKDGAQDVWTMALIANDAAQPATMIGGAGFGEMRAYMLANCKN